jgi:D-3-phosphoglycerate dehydrogenase
LENCEKKDFFTNFSGLELYQARLGVIGLGRIGSRVAALGKAIGMHVSGYDPIVGPERAAELGIELVTEVDAVLDVADVVTIHIPLLPETRNLINAARLARMKPVAILINAARGGLVDEQALFDALSSGHLAGAGLDVFEVEPPPPDHPLLGLRNVVATPHIAGATLAGKDRLWQTAISQTLQVLQGEKPPHLINSGVWPLAARYTFMVQQDLRGCLWYCVFRTA